MYVSVESSFATEVEAQLCVSCGMDQESELSTGCVGDWTTHYTVRSGE